MHVHTNTTYIFDGKTFPSLEWARQSIIVELGDIFDHNLNLTGSQIADIVDLLINKRERILQLLTTTYHHQTISHVTTKNVLDSYEESNQ